MKNKNSKLIIGAVVLISTGAYLVFRFLTKNKSNSNIDSNIDSNKSNQEQNTKSSENLVQSLENTNLQSTEFPLKIGSKGKEVVVLQNWLNDNDYARPKLVDDGVFGSKTENAVNFLQTSPRLKVINDYFTAVTFNGKPIKKGQITKDFYEIFIVKTKKIENSTLIKNLKNPLSL